MLDFSDDLRISGTPLYLDSREPRALCFISHAHSDHTALHARAIATHPTARIAGYRIGIESRNVVEIGYRIDFDLEKNLRLRLLPAGHVLGSAMLHAQTPDQSLLYTGDFKLRTSRTVPTALPERADVLVMESTYGRPFFKFPQAEVVAQQLVEIASTALREGRQPIVMGYSLGKAQETIRILTDAGLPVTCHGAVASMCDIYESCGVPLGPYRRYRFDDFHGPHPLDLAERGVLVAPPHVARSAFVTRFKNPCRIVMTGWALLKNAIYRYGVDHALPLSDHADFSELLELIEQVRPKKIFTCHGYPEFVEDLRSMGLDATYAQRCDQLQLFGD